MSRHPPAQPVFKYLIDARLRLADFFLEGDYLSVKIVADAESLGTEKGIDDAVIHYRVRIGQHIQFLAPGTQPPESLEALQRQSDNERTQGIVYFQVSRR